MLLWNPLWFTAKEFRVARGRLDLLIVGWQPGFFVHVGNPLVLQEIPFGGYRFYVKLRDEFWLPNSKEWELQAIFEDVYAIDPNTGLPVNAGDVVVRIGVGYPEKHMALVLDMGSILPTYYFTQTPVMPDDYWAKNTTPYQTQPPFQYVP